MSQTNEKPKRSPELYEALLTLKTVEECMLFFDDLCTQKEIHALEQRFQVASMLHEGKIYNAILEKIPWTQSGLIIQENRDGLYCKG